MKNTLENKKSFFALYWGQEVFNNGFMGDYSGWHFTGANHDEIDDGDFMVLKPLSAISEEDHKEILENEIYNTEKSVQKDKIGNYYTSDIAITDYLRSKGYALPYMGLPVENQIEYGWIKLKY